MSQSVGLLEKSTGMRPTGIRSPYTYMSPYTLELLKRAGLLYDTTVASLDEPYELELDGRPTGIIELPANWLLDDAVFLPANGSLPSPRLMLQTFKDDFDVAYREGTLVMLILHPHVIGHRSRIRYLEELLLYMKSAMISMKRTKRVRCFCLACIPSLSACGRASTISTA